MTTRVTTIPKRVAAGAALLDAEWDGWEAEIDLDRLDMSIGTTRPWLYSSDHPDKLAGCILTQLWGSYPEGRLELGIGGPEAEELGFEAMRVPLGSEYEALGSAWTALIEARRA